MLLLLVSELSVFPFKSFVFKKYRARASKLREWPRALKHAFTVFLYNFGRFFSMVFKTHKDYKAFLTTSSFGSGFLVQFNGFEVDLRNILRNYNFVVVVVKPILPTTIQARSCSL